jgi:hypothetical protein
LIAVKPLPPLGLDVADNGLTAFADMNVLARARSVRSRSAAAATSARPSKNACSRVSWRRGAAVVSSSTMAAVPSGSFAGTTSVCVNTG